MIIHNEEGRARSIRTPNEEIAEIEKMIGAMSRYELDALKAVIADLESGNSSEDDLMSLLLQYRYRWEPVSIEQFIDDPYYFGASTTTLYPGVRQALIDMFSQAGNREAILTGSIGWGKTMCMSIAMGYLLYLMSCLRAPQLAYGLSPGSEIVIALISKSLNTARAVMKTAVDDKLKLSPYFMERFPPEFSKDATHFPNNIMLAIGSCNSERIIGMNVFGGAMDEANFMASKGEVIRTAGKKSVANFDLAEKTYGSLERRIKSRFMDSGGDLPGLVCLVSSANTLNSFVDRLIREKKNDPSVFCRDFSTWDVKPGSFSGERFHVLAGASSMRSKILREGEVVPDELLVDGARVISVPVEYRPDFERDLEGSLRDVAGISTQAISVYVHRIDKVHDAVKPYLSHPFTDVEWTFGTPGGWVWERIAKKVQVRLQGGYTEEKWIPLRRPDVPRHLHFDPSLSGDCFGISMGYIDRWVEVVRRTANGEQYMDMAPHFVIEFMLRVYPPFGDQIFLSDMRAFFAYALMDHGFAIGGFSCDSFQSAETIQQMRRKGVSNSLMISVDTSTEPYDMTKTAIYENRIDMYDYAPFKEEFLALEYDRMRGKIDHPVAGSKDVSDAVAGVIAGLMQSSSRQPLAPVATEVSADVDDNSWITGGSIMVTPQNIDSVLDNARSAQPSGNSHNRAPLPFLFGD